MLLNEFLKAHRKVEEQETTIAQLKKQVETLVAHSQEQDSQIQRISEQPKWAGWLTTQWRLNLKGTQL
jgi:hypothetical protein